MPRKKRIPKSKRIPANTGKALAAALRKVKLSPAESRAWMRDLKAARKALLPQRDKWEDTSLG